MFIRKRYRVGYKRPPVATQFKPGQSGNPRGRPKGTLNLKTDLESELKLPVIVRENGREIKVSRQRGTVKVLIERALKGDLRAMGILIGLMERLIPEAAPMPQMRSG